MGNQQKTTKFSIKELLLFFLVVFCFVCVPAFILSYSLYIYLQIDEEKIINNLKTYSQHMANELRHNLYADIATPGRSVGSHLYRRRLQRPSRLSYL